MTRHAARGGRQRLSEPSTARALYAQTATELILSYALSLLASNSAGGTAYSGTHLRH